MTARGPTLPERPEDPDNANPARQPALRHASKPKRKRDGPKLPGRRCAAVPLVAPRGAEVGELLVSQVRDAMLGLAPAPARVSAGAVRAGLDGALADFRDSRYGRLSVTLPRLISAGHVLAATAGTPGSATRCWRGSTR